LQQGPWKELDVCNVVPGAGSGGPAAIPAGDRRIPAGGGWGSGLGTSRVRFGGSIAGEELPEGGHAGGGGRRGCLSGEVGARLVVRKGWRARGETGEVAARLLWRAAGRSWQLAVAACLAPEEDTAGCGGSARRGGERHGSF
jgi:hypothetical protein